MDTDSAYMAMTDNFENIIKLELKDEFEKNKHKWFSTDEYSKRTPGLFKIEYEGEGMVALCSKTYYVWGSVKDDKASSKGLQKKSNSIINKEKYLNCLFNREVINGINKGFRFDQKEMKTYEQNNVGLSLEMGKNPNRFLKNRTRTLLFEEPEQNRTQTFKVNKEPEREPNPSCKEPEQN